MKMDVQRRPLRRDLVDCIPSAPTGTDIVDMPIRKIQPYHDHPFHLYTGDRLADMVESIRTNGILTPCIIQQLSNGHYEMLAGHNRMNAAQIAGLDTIPVIIKTGLTEDEAWTYVMETNFRQRSFGELFPSEQAAILTLQYGKMSNQGKRSDIEHELDKLENKDSGQTDIQKPRNSRKDLAEEYHLSSATIARLLRINFLIKDFKMLLDAGKMKQMVCVEISYLSVNEQTWLRDFLHAYTYRLDLKTATALHARSKQGGMTKEILWNYLQALDKQKPANKYQTVKVPKCMYQKFFSDTPAQEIEEIMAKALELYYASLNS